MTDFLTNLTNGEVLSSEWAPVIGVGLVFFLVQIVLCASFCFRLRRQERAIKRLSRDFKQGGDGRNGIRSLGRKHAWLQWVDANFAANSISPTNFTREDALHELDTQIASNGNYLLLQRMGVMAPLLGVVLTVAGFYWLRVGDDEQSLQTILLAVTPLISGVGTGAVLAIINQALLHIASRRVESLRMAARSWFDQVIWSRFGSGGLPTNLSAAQVMEHFVRSALDDMNRLSDTLARAAEISVAMSALPGQFRRILDRKLPAAQSTAAQVQSGRSATPLPRSSVTGPAPHRPK
jgi:hypothetical protein